MRVIAISENTTTRQDISCEHGLSLFIDLDGKHILFDTGASDKFLENAKTLGVDISSVDLAIISHGHNDHGGGLRHFLAQNNKAPVYIHANAFEDYFVKREEFHPIGLDQSLKLHPQIQLLNQDYTGETFSIFAGVKGDNCRPAGNATLYKKTDTDPTLDDFTHEQNLVLWHDQKSVLICGCAHNGILNILETFHEKFACYPNVVIGGFHLYNPTTKQDEAPEVVEQIAANLIKTGSRFFTCHCTGENSYNRLKESLGNRISYLRAGDAIEL